MQYPQTPAPRPPTGPFTASQLTLAVTALLSACGGGNDPGAASTNEAALSQSDYRAVQIAAVASTSVITVAARASLIDGVGALMKVRVNGVEVASAQVQATTYTDITYSVPAIAAGAKVDVVFTNDATTATADRNLWVRDVTVDGVKMLPTGSGVTIDRGTGTAAFDGLDTVPGQEGIYWNAALRLTVPGTPPAPPPPPAPGAALPWSSPSTWGGTKPTAGAAVVIPAGKTIVLDETTPALGELIIEGELRFKQGVTTELKADLVRVRSGGALRAGSAGTRFTGRATVTLSGRDTTTADPMGTRGILVSTGGKLELYGNPPARTWTRLNAHAEAGATALTLEQPVTWLAGDQIVVAPTEWYPDPNASQGVQDALQQTERRTVSAANGSTLTLGAGLTQFKWGRLQYVTDAGMSLTPGTFTKPHADAVDKLDERAEVGNLSRNIVIQGADDALWRDSGFGAQVMVMDRSSSLQLDGVELRRVGQAGKVGRYPIHWHLLSYNTATGKELGDATGHFVRNSSIWDSRQRCVVVHGTNGVSITNNICYDIKGHAIFLEDAVERRNVIEGNLVLKVRSPVEALAVAEHEKRNPCGASAGYWLTNPDNTVRNNAVADAQGNGFWLSYPRLPVKQHTKVAIRPNNLRHGLFEFNSARSNGNKGVMLECAMTNDAGNVDLLYYEPTVDGSLFNYQNGVRTLIKGITTAKNRGGYVNRVVQPDYLQWAAADNVGRAFSGAVQAGSTLKQSLLIGKSLNDRQAYPGDGEPQLGVASYHSAMDIAQNTFVNLPNRGYLLTQSGNDVPSGAFGTDDYYLRPLEKGFARSPGNKLINADAGYRALPPHLQPGYTPATLNNWTLAGAIWDPQGYWGTAGRYSVLNSPFLRDASCVTLGSRVPAGLANGLSCAGPYYGVQDFTLNRGLPGATPPYNFQETIEVDRQDAAGNSIGRWRVEQGLSSRMLGNMRHFAAVAGGIYVLRFPEFPQASTVKNAPRWVSMNLDNLRDPTDRMLLGVHFDGATAPSRVFLSTNPDYPDFASNSRLLTAASSRAAVESSDGSLYWRDTARNLIWVKLTPLGLDVWSGATPGSDADLYRPFKLRIEP